MTPLELMLSAELEPEPTQAKPAGRWYYRCLHCLEPFALESEVKSKFNPARGYTELQLECSCRGPVELMGKVFQAALANKITKCACDSRCTHARGPSRDCRCGGANHGRGTTVTLMEYTGEIPKISGQNEAQKQHAGDTYRKLRDAARAAINAKFGRVLEAKHRGDYIGQSDFALYCNGRRKKKDLAEICGGRIYKTRNAKLEKFIGEI